MFSKTKLILQKISVVFNKNIFVFYVLIFLSFKDNKCLPCPNLESISL